MVPIKAWKVATKLPNQATKLSNYQTTKPNESKATSANHRSHSHQNHRAFRGLPSPTPAPRSRLVWPWPRRMGNRDFGTPGRESKSFAECPTKRPNRSSGPSQGRSLIFILFFARDGSKSSTRWLGPIKGAGLFSARGEKPSERDAGPFPWKGCGIA